MTKAKKTLASDFLLSFPSQGFSNKIFNVGYESIYASFIGKYLHTDIFILVSGPEWDQKRAADPLNLSQSSRISYFPPFLFNCEKLRIS